MYEHFWTFSPPKSLAVHRDDTVHCAPGATIVWLDTMPPDVNTKFEQNHRKHGKTPSSRDLSASCRNSRHWVHEYLQVSWNTFKYLEITYSTFMCKGSHQKSDKWCCPCQRNVLSLRQNCVKVKTGVQNKILILYFVHPGSIEMQDPPQFWADCIDFSHVGIVQIHRNQWLISLQLIQLFEDRFESVGDLVGFFMPQVPYQEGAYRNSVAGSKFCLQSSSPQSFQLDHLVPASLNFRWNNVQQKIHIMLKALKTIAFSTPCVLVAVRK